MGFLALIPIVLAMIFAGIIIDVGLTSIYAHFGWEFWPTFTAIGAIIGLIRGVSKAHWRLATMLAFAFAGFVMAKQWMIDGIVLAVIIVVVYCATEDRYDR